MQTGRNLQDVARDIVAQKEKKRDYIGSTNQLTLMAREVLSGDVRSIDNGYKVQVGNGESLMGEWPVTRHAQRQIGERLRIPGRFWDRIGVDHPDLLVHTVNNLWSREPEDRLVRVLDEPNQGIRAVMSSRYRVMDHIDMLDRALLPALADLGDDVEVMSSEVTPQRFYLKAAFPKTEGEIRQGDTVQAGFILKNSEIGMGSLQVAPFIVRLACINGMVAEHLMRAAHLGGRRDTGGEGDWRQDILSSDTIRARDEYTWKHCRDAIKAMTDRTQFDKILDRIRRTSDIPINDPSHAMEQVAKRFRLSDGEKVSALSSFLESDDLTAWGLANAITATAGKTETGAYATTDGLEQSRPISYDRSTELETLGAKILDIPQKDWSSISGTKPAAVPVS